MKQILIRLREKLFRTNEIASNLSLSIGIQKQIKEEQNFAPFLAHYLDYKYFPLSHFTISTSVIQYVYNDLLYKPNSKIIEFGAGLSTVAIAKFIIKEDLDTHLYTVENDNNWLQFVKNYLGSHASDERFHFIHAPLQKSPYIYKEHKRWFDVDVIDKHIHHELKFDVLLVDGPIGYKIPQSRYGFLPFTEKYIKDTSIIYVDDTDRPDELELASLLSEKYHFSMQAIGTKTKRLHKK